MIRIGTRGSQLALWQAAHVEALLRRVAPNEEIVTVTIKTTGDRVLDKPLAEIGGKGLFLKEIEDALLGSRVDLAVHSMKDVPAELPPGLTITAILEREDPRDALITANGRGLAELPAGARVGTGSLRRQCQLKHWRPDLEIVPLRGNVDTRLRKLHDEEQRLDAIILAGAGLKRLGLGDRISEWLPTERLLPAAGQGAIGIEIRESDTALAAICQALHHPTSGLALTAERRVLARLEGSCKLPFAAHATIDGPRMHVAALVGSPDGREIVRDELEAAAENASAAGETLAERLLAAGAGRFLESGNG
ncbi:MAG: hydroxymethylbilane synthase [Myxococcales bacterium]|nr:hydroxymethylbilane synthase [Myxococcales bacterium]